MHKNSERKLKRMDREFYLLMITIITSKECDAVHISNSRHFIILIQITQAKWVTFFNTIFLFTESIKV